MRSCGPPCSTVPAMTVRPAPAVRRARSRAIIDPRPPRYAEPKAQVTLPPNLGRPPKASDLVIKRGFDGKTPDQAVDTIRRRLTSPVLPTREEFLLATARERHRDFTVALNNVFTPGSPNEVFLKSLGNVQITVLGQMSLVTPIVYKAVNPASGETKHYTRDWTGNFAPLTEPLLSVVMEARVRIDPPGLIMKYPSWSNRGLSHPAIVEEL